MPINCRICQAEIPNFESLQRHYIEVHQNQSNEAPVKKEHQETVTSIALTPPPLARCEHCGERFVLYKDLEKHYISQHQDQRRASLTGLCKLCHIMESAGYDGVGVEAEYDPDQVKPFSTYQELKDHYISVHWRHESLGKKEDILANRINLSF